MRRLSFALIVLLVVASAVAGDIPPRPEQLRYPGLTFNAPDAGAYKVKLANGVTAYVAEDRMLPLVNVQVMFKGGTYLEPAGKEGLAALTGTVWRTGGAGNLDAKALDEELDFLAAQVSTRVGDVTGAVSLNLLAKDVDRGLALLMDVLQKPRFEEARLAKAKEDALADMKRRNDDTGDIEAREWNRLVYGEDYWINRLSTKASLDGLTQADLVAFHKQLANPANMVLAVAGDFDRKAMISKLNSTFGAWKGTGPAVAAVPQPSKGAAPGVYMVNKPDVNQGRVSVGALGVKRPFADEFPMMVGNDILGGGGFTAWMMKKIRSDEGLTYGAYSEFGIGDLYPGEFRAYLQTKSSTVAFGIKLTLDLISKLRTANVGDEELVTSKNSFIETFPRNFESKMQTVARFASDDLTGRPHSYWTNYRQSVAAVNPEVIRKAASTHITPDGFIILLVGNVEEILKGHPDHADLKIEKFGPITQLPLRDPLTLKPLAN
jgi:zinc protease